MQENFGKLRNREDAARYVREKYARPCSTNLLDKMAVTGLGPEFRKVGRFVVYEESALDAWALPQIGPPQRSTSEAPARKPTTSAPSPQPQPEMARTKIPSYRVKNGNGFFEPTPAMRAAGIKPIACGPDGPAAWSKAREQLERWSDIKSRATPRRGSFAPAERQADGGREQ